MGSTNMSESQWREGMENQELFAYFKEDLFIPDLKSGKKEDVLEEMVEILVDSGKIKNRHLIRTFIWEQFSLRNSRRKFTTIYMWCC